MRPSLISLITAIIIALLQTKSSAQTNDLPLVANEDLTGGELANHLGILHWSGIIDLEPGTYRIVLYEIEKGKLTKPVIHTDRPGSGPRGTRFAIMMSVIDGTPKITLMQAGYATWSTVTDAAHAYWLDSSGSPSYITLPFPEKLKVGTYVLGGKFDPVYTGPSLNPRAGPPFKAPRSVEDFKLGFALKIENWDPKSAPPY